MFCSRIQCADAGRNHRGKVLVLLRKGIGVHDLVVDVLSLLVRFAAIEVGRLGESP